MGKRANLGKELKTAGVFSRAFAPRYWRLIWRDQRHAPSVKPYRLPHNGLYMRESNKSMSLRRMANSRFHEFIFTQINKALASLNVLYIFLSLTFWATASFNLPQGQPSAELSLVCLSVSMLIQVLQTEILCMSGLLRHCFPPRFPSAAARTQALKPFASRAC